MWKPGPTGRTVPMPEERFMDKPNMVPFLHTYSVSSLSFYTLNSELKFIKKIVFFRMGKNRR